MTYDHSTNLTTEILSPTLLNTPRQGLSSQISEIWKLIKNCFMDSASNRIPCYYFHASPGIGKTFLLKEISKKNIKDIPSFPDCPNIANKVEFIAISFNSITPYNETYESNSNHSDLVWSRIIFSQFIDKETSWNRFIVIYNIMKDQMVLNEDVLYKMLIKKYKTREMFVFLVDELTKILVDSLRNSVRSYLCEMQDRNTPIKALAIFSTLDPNSINDKYKSVGSLRPVHPILQ